MKAHGLVVLEKKIFIYVFPIVSLWELMTPGAGPFLTQGHDWQDLYRGQFNIATYKI